MCAAQEGAGPQLFRRGNLGVWRGGGADTRSGADLCDQEPLSQERLVRVQDGVTRYAEASCECARGGQARSRCELAIGDRCSQRFVDLLAARRTGYSIDRDFEQVVPTSAKWLFAFSHY